MSSSGIDAINSGPLIIRSYLGTSVNNTYVLGDNDTPVSSNRVLITSTNGLVAPSDNIYISSINISSINGVPYNPGDDAFWSGSLTGNISNDNSGNVGIGTTNPLVPLDVNGILRVGKQTGNTSSFEINLGTNGVGSYRSALIYSDGTNMEISNQQNGSLTLYTNNNPQITMLPSGNIGIGAINPEAKLDVSGDTIIRSYTYITPGYLGIGYLPSNPPLYQFDCIGNGRVSATMFSVTVDTDMALVHNNAIVSGYISTNTINMNNGIFNMNTGSNTGQITGLSTINGLVWPPIDDALWSKSGNNIYNDNTGGNVGIGTITPQAFLHIVEPTSSQVFTTFGTNTIVIPQGVISVSFEIIGAGGPINEPYYTTSGAGGYIKGTINTTTLTSSGPVTLTINIGSVTNGSNDSPSRASYISNGSELLVIAGAGGAFGGTLDTSGMGVPIQGGGGGGGTWAPVTGGFVSDGLPGDDSGNTTSPIVVGGHGGGGTGLTGGTAGLGGISGGAGLAGASQTGISPNYTESGGASPSGIGGGAGGNGFSGGGSSGYGLFNSSSIGDTGAGGGGSSYYNGTYITIINSLNGAIYSQNPIISNNYGLAGNGGYAVLSYISGEPSLITEGSVGIRTTNPQASLDIKGTLSTLSIIDNNGASGTSGQVLTAGTGGQVVWGSSPLQSGTAQFDNPNVQQTITTSYTLTSNSIIQLSWYNDNNANCQNPIYTISGSDYVKQVWWNLSGSPTQFQIEIGPVPADVGKYHLIKWALLSL